MLRLGAVPQVIPKCPLCCSYFLLDFCVPPYRRITKKMVPAAPSKQRKYGALISEIEENVYTATNSCDCCQVFCIKPSKEVSIGNMPKPYAQDNKMRWKLGSIPLSSNCPPSCPRRSPRCHGQLPLSPSTRELF